VNCDNDKPEMTRVAETFENLVAADDGDGEGEDNDADSTSESRRIRTRSAHSTAGSKQEDT